MTNVKTVESSIKKYPPPSKHPVFVKRWKEFIDDVAARENFKPGHLAQLEILCHLYAEYEDLKGALEFLGNTYNTGARNGDQIKMRPEIAQKSKVVDQIHQYTKMLGLLLVKDKENTDTGSSFDT